MLEFKKQLVCIILNVIKLKFRTKAELGITGTFVLWLSFTHTIVFKEVYLVSRDQKLHNTCIYYDVYKNGLSYDYYMIEHLKVIF